MSAEQRRRVAHGVEIAGATTASTAGSGFAAAKLRDAYRKDYPDRFARGVGELERHARRLGMNGSRATRLANIARAGEPGFIPLAVGTGAAAVATAADRYQGHLKRMDAKRARHGAAVALVAKADPGAELGKIPRYCHIKGIGRCRVLGYHGDNRFRVLDPSDSERIVHRDRLNFYPAKKKGTTMSKSAFGIDHGDISKSDPGPASGRRQAAAYFAGPAHGLVAGRKGQKLRAAGTELGHEAAGGYGGLAAGAGLGAGLGGAIGRTPGAKIGALLGADVGALGGGIAGARSAVNANQRKGRYKKEPMRKRNYDAAQRRELQAKGDARPGGRFPIANASDLHNALRRWADASPADRAYIRRRAAQLGVSLSDTGYAGSGKHGAGDAGGKKMFAEQGVSKSAKGTAAVLAGVGGAQVGFNEALRRHANKKGADISVRDQYLHPYRSQYAMGAANLRASAQKHQAKADATGSARSADRANRRRFMAQHRAGEAQQGSARYYRSLPADQRRGGVYRYDKNKHYAAPSGAVGIGKSAFGVEG